VKGTWREGSLAGDSGRKVEMAMEMGISIVAPLGNLEGVDCRDFLREKDSISGFLSWTQRIIKVKSGTIWKFGKVTGLS